MIGIRLRHCLTLLVLLVFACEGCEKKRDANNVVLLNSDPNDGGPPSGHDGAACVTDRQCDSDLCLTPASGWENGHCTTINCVEEGCNGATAECVSFLDGSSFCLNQCEGAIDCRPGYRCRSIDATGRKVCYRDDGDGPAAGRIGAECEGARDCRNGLVCDEALPGGYCLAPDCSGTCPEGATCREWNGEGQKCVQECSVTRDCRIGYVCDEEICVPSDAVEAPFEFAITREVLGITCGAEEVSVEDGGIRWRMNFDVPQGSTAYMVVPFVESGTLRPVSMTTPSGVTVDLVSDYRHHNLRVTEFQFFDEESHGVYGAVALDWPLLFPYAPQYTNLVESGSHELELLTSTDEPCLYLLGTDGSGVELDLNVYFVGLEGFTAGSAPADNDLSEIFNRVDELLGVAGVQLGSVQFYDAPREIAERYSFIRDNTELKRITAFGQPRNQTLRGHLNVDVFLVEDLTFGGAEVLGLSAGLPGPPGLHGNSANGLVFTGADIGEDNGFVAHIMAHELGHYLGLRHTTEVFHGLDSDEERELDVLLGTTDPIEDTAICDRVLFLGPNCPDANNLMFPAAPMGSIEVEVTEGQAATLRGNPLFHGAE